MRVLITGHRGYIGSVLVDLLKAAGHEVVGADTQLYKDCTFGGNADDGIPTINRDYPRTVVHRPRGHRRDRPSSWHLQ
jgi:nucleoside-diphosphate-sugar epimerase